jgi:hypothetical protein
MELGDMKKKYVLIIIGAIIVASIAILTIVLLGGFLANDSSFGPAPNSGDGVSDGSGLEKPNYQNQPSLKIKQSTGINSLFLQAFNIKK